MIHRTTWIALCFISFITSANTNVQELIILFAGTPLYLTLNQNINSEEVEIGYTVEFLVRSDVTVNKQVVIAAGSIAEGRIAQVIKACGRRCNNHCAKVVIQVESVQAVDGQRIYLRGIPFEARGDCYSGTPAQVGLGTVFSARILNNIKIQV